MPAGPSRRSSRSGRRWGTGACVLWGLLSALFALAGNSALAEDAPATDSLTDEGTQTDPIPSADAGTQPDELGPRGDASDGDEEPGELGPQEGEPGAGPLRAPTGGLAADDLEPQPVDDQPDTSAEPLETEAPALDSV